MTSAIQQLASVFASADDDSRLLVQALLTLHLVGGADATFLQSQLAHSNQHVRAWAVRLLTETLPLDDALGPVWMSIDRDARRDVTVDLLLPRLKQMARQDTSPLVRLTLASTLQRLPISDRPALAAR